MRSNASDADGSYHEGDFLYRRTEEISSLAEELEDELAISVIVSKAVSRNSEQLWKLNRRLAALRGGRPVSDEHNPFGPAAVCHALQLAIHQLELESKSRFVIYKHLGKIFIVSFSKALTALNDNLSQQGILPNLRFSVTSAAATEGSDTAVATSLPLGDEGGSDTKNLETNTAIESQASITNQQQIFAAIRSLQAETGPREGGVNLEGLTTDGSTGSADTFVPVDYALALSAVQQSQDFLHAVAICQQSKLKSVLLSSYRNTRILMRIIKWLAAMQILSI